MCNYCDDNNILIKKDDLISPTSFGWGDDDTKINLSQTANLSLIVFVDRGYLRLADAEDCGCLDHDEKILINYCPMCGKKLR